MTPITVRVVLLLKRIQREARETSQVLVLQAWGQKAPGF
jgi:hypothetical protein